VGNIKYIQINSLSGQRLLLPVIADWDTSVCCSGYCWDVTK